MAIGIRVKSITVFFPFSSIQNRFPEMHLFPRFQLSNRCPASSKYTDSSRCPACTFPPIAPLINTSVKWFSSPPLAPLSCFHPLSRLPQTTEPRFYLWQAQATRFFICFSGFWMFFGSADPPSIGCPASTVAPLVRSTKTGKKHFRKCGAV